MALIDNNSSHVEHQRRIQGPKSGAAWDLASSGPLKEEDAAYFSELLGYSMERLAREPELLASEQEYLARQAADVVSSHRRALVESAKTTQTVGELLTGASGRLNALQAALPRLQAAGEAFQASAARIETSQRETQLLAAHHGSLLDILEVPSLMMTCVRNRHYDEALDLRAFVRRLETLHGGLPLILRLSEEAEDAMRAMREALLRNLETEVALPECLRAVGFLRRLGGFTERGLRLKFLARRDAWVASTGRSAGLAEADGPAYEALKRATDALRLQLFDVTGQYLAVFGAKPAAKDNDDEAMSDDILPTWARRRVEAYLSLFAHHLPRLTDGGALASIAEAAMYAGASLGRVGLDIRPLLAPAFERAVVGIFDAGVAGAEAACRRLAAQNAWTGVRRTPDSQVGGEQKGEEGNGSNSGSSSSKHRNGATSTAAPSALLAYPPLAVYANGIAAAINEVRHCALLVCAPALAARLRDSLIRIHEMLLRSKQAEAAAALGLTLAPYVAGNLARVFGTTTCALGLDANGLGPVLVGASESIEGTDAPKAPGKASVENDRASRMPVTA